MENIDELTLKLLINKNQYNKYLMKNEPEKHEETKKFIEKIKNNKNEILNLIEEFLENPEKQYSNDFENNAISFIKTCIKMIEINKTEQYIIENEDDEDMFSNCIDNPLKINDTKKDEIQEFLQKENYEKRNDSYWGKKIKKSNISNYDALLFSK